MELPIRRRLQHQLPQMVFAKTGISPFNPNIFPDYMFAAAETTNKPATEDGPIPSTSSSLSAPPSTTGPSDATPLVSCPYDAT